MPKSLIVVIEDERDIQDMIAYNLQREGYEVVTAERGDEGLALVQDKRPDLIILDLMLPGLDGLSVCQSIRFDTTTQEIPIIVLSAKSEEADIVIGLGLGADDYIPKPFSPKELLARVKAILRRGGNHLQKAKDTLVHEGIRVDLMRHQVFLNDEELRLTATEFGLLTTLVEQPGRVFSREQLITRVLGETVVVIDRNIDVHIRSVRKKLGADSGLIETVRGVGYRFVNNN
ncbi:MAG: response regulator [Gammaproteobacteria bacterium TMED182]|nr:DNA-binding response regulator [Gammaproteobacteria bacterium]RPG48598.1 MAG: response regulator [Gammaproteobacteria bacterium TMED182]